MPETDEDYEPDGVWWHDSEPDLSPIPLDPLAHWNTIIKQWARSYAKYAHQQRHYASQVAGTHIHVSILDEFTAGIQKAAEAIAALPKQNDLVESNPETPREKALRLKRQPHSMSRSHGYDRRGRKR